MSLRSMIAPRVSQWLTSPARLDALRARFERRRAARGEPHRIDWFHEAADPHSHTGLLGLRALAQAYDVEIAAHLVGPPPDWAAPERAMLAQWARDDAARLAGHFGLDFAPVAPPDAGRLASAEAALAQAIKAGRFLEDAPGIGDALWRSQKIDGPAQSDAAAARADGEARRAALGHFRSAMAHFAGEWFWGLDRLHHLQDRLDALGLRRPGTGTGPVLLSRPAPSPVPGAAKDVHFYLSFRSPYTWIATERAHALAQAYGAELRLRYVLPMVMRGLPVPPAKRMDILQDAAREARAAGVAFGRICDPLGRPVERGYAILRHAIAKGAGYAFAHAFMQAVWSKGVDAGSDAGLRRIVETAGLDWAAARSWLDDDGWRAEAESNRLEMTSLGLWGVPSFRVGDSAVWGQDRFWAVEEALAA